MNKKTAVLVPRVLVRDALEYLYFSDRTEERTEADTFFGVGFDHINDHVDHEARERKLRTKKKESRKREEKLKKKIEARKKKGKKKKRFNRPQPQRPRSRPGKAR